MSSHALIETSELYFAPAAACQCGTSGQESASFMATGGSPLGESSSVHCVVETAKLLV